MVKTILVGLGDATYSLAATEHAIELAKQHQARLRAVTIVDPASFASGPAPIGAGGIAKELREHREEQTRDVLQQAVKEFDKAAKKAKLDYDVLQETGAPFQTLISQSRYFDLVICGLRNLFSDQAEGPPKELFALVEDSVRPLMAVSEAYRPIERILVAYSGSTESANTMRRFVQQRLWPDAAIRLVTFARDDDEGQQRIEDASAYFQSHGITPEVEVVNESPKDTLLSYARGWNADLIVMGNSAKRLLLRKIFGETALQVLSHADRPLYLSQ